MTTLSTWIDAVCAELGLDRSAVDERALLDLTRKIAHPVDRPAAPVTAFLLGLAVGGGQPASQAAARLTALADNWPANP